MTSEIQPLAPSAADPLEDVQRPVVPLALDYADGHHIAPHAHARVQFLYATSGLMRAQTRLGSWVVPTGYGLVIPDGIEHEVQMFGAVTLQSVYLAPDRLQKEVRANCKVVRVSELLAASIDRFATRPLEYGPDDIAHHLAEVIILEITDAPPSAMALPFPRSGALAALCETMLADPAMQRTIDQWAGEVGMSRRTFTRAFRRETGLSFDAWRQRLRYQAAAQQLAQGVNLKKVAASVGYGSAAALKSMMTRLN